MNEPANFGTNEEKPWNWPEDWKPYWSLKCSTEDPMDGPKFYTTSMLLSEIFAQLLLLLRILYAI